MKIKGNENIIKYIKWYIDLFTNKAKVERKLYKNIYLAKTFSNEYNITLNILITIYIIDIPIFSSASLKN